MDGVLSDIASVWGRVEPGWLVWPALWAVLACVLYALHLRLKSKGAAGILALCKWLAVFGMLRALDAHVLHDAYGTILLVLCGIALWMAFRALLSVYANVYLGRIKHRPANRIVLSLLSFFAALALVVYGLRSSFNVDVSALLTSSAILTAVIGFSLQDTIGSLFSGILLQMENPAALGDWVRVGDIEGQVTGISWRYTTLTTSSQERALIPNNTVAKERIVNYSEPIPQANVTVNVPAPVDVPPVVVKSALEDVLRKAPLVVKNPAPSVRLAEIGLDQLTYRLSFYTHGFDGVAQARNEVLSGVWYEFMRQRIDFPVNRRLVLTPGPKPALCEGLDIASLVGGVELFKGMPVDEVELLARCSAIRVYAPETRIVERGQSGSTMFLIASGRVAVSLENGVEVARLGPGDVFGEMALLTGEPRTADVTAVDPATCLEIDREAFRMVLEKNPALLANVHRVFEERVSQQRDANRRDSHELAEGLFACFRRIFFE